MPNIIKPLGGLTTSAQLAAALSDETGTGVAVFNNTPTLITPVLGDATCTSINALTPTALATGFSIAGGTTSKTLTVDETISISAKAPIASPAFTTQISTPKIVTASGNLEIGNVIRNTCIVGTNIFYHDSNTTSPTQMYFTNTAGGMFIGVESSIGGSLIVGSVGYDATLRGISGLSFSANNGSSVHLRISSTGNVGIGVTVPTAVLHLKAGTATANTAPLKFTSGFLLTTTEAGAIEFLTDAYYATITTGAGTAAARKTIAFLESPVFTTQISTPKIVTASGNLIIIPAANAAVTIGDGTVSATQSLIISGGSNTGKGAGISLQKGGTQYFGLYDEATITGAGTSNTPCLFAETGLGMKIFVNGELATAKTLFITPTMKVGIAVDPTARLHLPAGTTVANTAPLQFTSGPPETTPRAGLVEYYGANFLATATDLLNKPLNNQYVLASKLGANFNVTTDQSITIPAGRWIIRKIVVNNASISLTTAAGGLYTGASKTGTTIVGAGQVYTALTASGKFLDLTLDAAMATDILTATTIYFSLTTAQGAAATGDIFIIGDRLDY